MRNKIVYIMLMILIFLINLIFVNATTYYVCDGGAICNSGDGVGWNTGLDSNDCLSKDNSCLTISQSLSKMSEGDTLIIGDGNYTGADNMIQHQAVPSGSVDSYSIVKAENDFMVIIDAEHIQGQNPCELEQRSYVILRGIECRRGGGYGWDQSGSPVRVHGSDHIKLIRMGAMDGREIFPNNPQDSSTFVISGSSYVLAEECYAYGWGHYTFVVYDSDYTIFRRCVGRQDIWGHGVGDTFSNYQSSYTEYQNCIAIDMDQPRHWHPGGVDALWGGFNINADSNNIFYRGCIAMNIQGTNGVTIKDPTGESHGANYNPCFRLGETGDTTFMENCACIGSIEGVMTYDAVEINSCSFIDINEDINPSFWDGEGISYVTNNRPVVSNSLFLNNEDNGVSGISSSSNYNGFFNNDNDYAGGSVEGSNDVYTDPELLYPVRIEDGSSYKRAGENEKDIGANIVKRYGVSGTLYGEENYNTLTNENLWPFPNEEIIKERMAAYNRWDQYDNIDSDNLYNLDTYVDGKRGFCADGNGLYGGPITLTSYIWEYLGNECPEEICFNKNNETSNENISSTELLVYIEKWIDGDVSTSNLFEVVNIWKN